MLLFCTSSLRQWVRVLLVCVCLCSLAFAAVNNGKELMEDVDSHNLPPGAHDVKDNKQPPATTPASPSRKEIEACAQQKHPSKCLENPNCLWCIGMRSGWQCAHREDPDFLKHYTPKLEAHIDDMCANANNVHEVFQKAKNLFSHAFDTTAALDLKKVPKVRRFFGARLLVAVSLSKRTYLFELSTGSSNANRVSINKDDKSEGGRVPITTAGFWLPVGGLTGGTSYGYCDLTSTICDTAFLTTGGLLKPHRENVPGADEQALAAIENQGGDKPAKKSLNPIKKFNVKAKKPKPFSNHLLVPILERFTFIEQLQASMLLSQNCDKLFSGVTGLSTACIKDWHAKCVSAANLWGVFIHHKRLTALPPTPPEVRAAVKEAVDSPYHMAVSDVEAQQIMEEIHKEKPIFAFTGPTFGDLHEALDKFKKCKVPAYLDEVLKTAKK